MVKIIDRSNIIAVWQPTPDGPTHHLKLDTDKNGRREVLASVYLMQVKAEFQTVPLSTIRRIYEGDLSKVNQDYLDAIHTRLDLGLRDAIAVAPAFAHLKMVVVPRAPLEHSVQAGIAAAASLDGWTNHTFLDIVQAWAQRVVRTSGAL